MARGGRGDWRRTHTPTVHARCWCYVCYKVSLSFSRIHKETCFLFQLGETLNPELQIITSVFSKVIHRGEYKYVAKRSVKRFFPALFLNQVGNSVVTPASLLRNITLACIAFNDVITFFLLTLLPRARDVHLAVPLRYTFWNDIKQRPVTFYF